MSTCYDEKVGNGIIQRLNKPWTYSSQLIEKHHNGMLYKIVVQNIWRPNKHCTQSWEFRWEASKGMFGIRKKRPLH